MTLRFLPRFSRPAVSLAYLMARWADTVVDAEGLELAQRQAGLEAWRDFLASGEKKASVASLCLRPGRLPPAEEKLLLAADDLARAHFELEPEQRECNRRVLLEVLEGQLMDLHFFGNSCAEHPAALPDREALDRYCRCVAGSVGRYWTELHGGGGDGELVALGERFGKGLQLVNILRDLAADLGRGRCYLPGDELGRLGLEPAALTAAGAGARLRPVFDAWLQVARGHLLAGLRYLELLPGGWRLRASTSWPLLIGLRTLELLSARPLCLQERRPLKVSRAQVYGLVGAGTALSLWPFWTRLLGDFIEPRRRRWV